MHKCIDWANPLPCCYMAEKARDKYDLLMEQHGWRGDNTMTFRDVLNALTPDERVALDRGYGIG